MAQIILNDPRNIFIILQLFFFLQQYYYSKNNLSSGSADCAAFCS